MTVLQISEIIVNFALIRLVVDKSAVVKISVAFYESVCLTTLNPLLDGAGGPDVCGPPIGLQTAQLLYSLVFFVVVVPVTINSVRTTLRKLPA